MTNRMLKDINISKYGYICMAGYEITKQNPLTMHHIISLSEGGQTVLENSSNVTSLPHSGIHVVSRDDVAKADEIIDYLYYYKLHRDALAAKQFKAWLKNEMYRLEYEEYLTKNKTLIYKRRN